MATVPSYGEGPKLRETPLQLPQATPASFGAAQGAQLQDLGRGISVAGQTTSNILVKMQEHENLQVVFDAETKLKTWETEYHDTVRQRKGVNAKDVSVEAVKAWDDKYAEVTQGLANKPQQEAFQRIYQNRRNQSIGMINQHEVTEKYAATNEAGAASIEATIQNGIGNPGAADENAASIAAAYRSLAKINGTSGAKVDAQILDAQTRMHAGVIDSLVNEYPGAARAYYNEVIADGKKAGATPQIRYSMRTEIEATLRSGDLKGFAQRKATEIMDTSSDEAEQLRLAREIVTPEKQAAAVAEVRARQAERRSISDRAESEAYQETLSQVVAPGSAIRTVLDIDPALWESMSGTGQQNIKNHLAAKVEKKLKGRTTDDVNVRRLVDRLIQDNQLTDASQLSAYDPHLTDTTLKGFETAIEKAKQVSRAVLHTEYASRVRSTEAKWSADQHLQWAAFQDYAYKSVQEGVYTNRDIKDLADDFFLKTGEGWWDGVDEMTFGEALTEHPEILDDALGLSNAWVVAASRQAGEEGGALDITRRGLLVAVHEAEAANVPFDKHHIAAAIILRSVPKKRTTAALKHLATRLRVGELRLQPLQAPAALAPAIPSTPLPQDFAPE